MSTNIALSQVKINNSLCPNIAHMNTSMYVTKKILYICMCCSYGSFPSLISQYLPTNMDMKRIMLCAFSCLGCYLCYEVLDRVCVFNVKIETTIEYGHEN